MTMQTTLITSIRKIVGTIRIAKSQSAKPKWWMSNFDLCLTNGSTHMNANAPHMNAPTRNLAHSLNRRDHFIDGFVGKDIIAR